MLVNTRLGDTFQAYAIDAPQADPAQVTFQPRSVGTWTPGPGAAAAWFAEDGRSVLFRQDENGNQLYQLFLLRDGDRSPTLLTDGKSRNGAPVWSTKGDRIAYLLDAARCARPRYLGDEPVRQAQRSPRGPGRPAAGTRSIGRPTTGSSSRWKP